MAIDAVTGQIVWVPEESQGPGNYTIQVVVTDENPPAVNDTHLSVTNRFNVIVREVNRAPVLANLLEQRGDELTLLSFKMVAMDPDLPANTLAYSLVSAPLGMTINPETGIINWMPTEAQGPSTNEIKVRVQDSGVPPLTATNSVIVVVREVNVAPQLILPAETTVDDCECGDHSRGVPKEDEATEHRRFTNCRENEGEFQRGYQSPPRRTKHRSDRQSPGERAIMMGPFSFRH